MIHMTDYRMDPVLQFHNFPQIRHNIFGWLQRSQLLKCSAVSKKWWQEVRNIMSRRKCYAYVRRSCNEFMELNSLLRTKFPSLINGVHVNLAAHADCSDSLWDAELGAYHMLRAISNLRFLHFQVGCCPVAQRLMSCLLLDSCASLEELYMAYGDRLDSFLNCPLPVHFPTMKVITVEPKFGAPWADATALIRCSPNLEKVVGLIGLRHLRGLNEQQIGTLTGVHCVPYTAQLDETFVKLTSASPKLRELQIYDLDTRKRTVPPLWSQNLCQLLECSSLTLQSLSICAVELLKYFRNSGPAVSKLKKLEIFFPEEAEVWHFSSTVAALRMNSNLPAVESLRVSFSDHCYHDISGIHIPAHSRVPVKAVRNIMLEDPACTIDTLHACCTQFTGLISVGLEFIDCAEMCTGRGSSHCYEFCRAFTEIPNLEELKICLVEAERSPQGFSLDALLCGLTTAEAEQLKSSSRGGTIALQKLKYCPIRPSIHSAKNLTKLRLVFPPYYTYSTFCVSEISGYLATTRLSRLKFQIESHCSSISNELTSMAPFAEITYVTPGKDWW